MNTEMFKLEMEHYPVLLKVMKLFFLHIYIYGNQVVGIQHIFFIFKELIKMKKI